MSNEHRGSLDSVPQWKKELILRRRAVARFLPAGSTSVQLSCPSVVAAVRFPEYSPASDLHLKACVNERVEQAVARKNMRLIEQVNTSGNFVEPGLQSELKRCSKVENDANYILDMGEEKTAVKKRSNGQLPTQKKCSDFTVNEDDSLSDSSEELKYGPGIVSRLKSRYLSLTLRESQGRIRPNLPYLRRATSLENILDETENCEESKPKYIKNVNTTFNGSISERCRSITRGNKDPMKRAGSVETLLRYDRRKDVHQYSKSCEKSAGDEYDENKLSRRSISNALEDKELPPPDLVKHTLKIFESSNNITKNFSLCKVNTLTKSLKDGNAVSGKKPALSPRPPCSKVNKCVSDQRKSASENFVRLNPVEPVKRNEKHESLQQKKTTNNATGLEKFNSVERSAKPVAYKDKLNDVSGVKNIGNDPTNSELPLDNVDGEGRLKIRGTNNVLTSPDSSGIISPTNNNAVNGSISENDKKSSTPPSTPDVINEEIKNLEMVRSLSPVLVKAPPCILSSEVNANSQTQPVKQLGVVRPIVINKTSQQILPLIKCSINKSHSALTEREIEKNLINSVKSIEQPVTKVIVSLKKSPEECMPCDFKQNEENKNRLIWDGRKPNTMVFNFSNRKTVPDYIENDGLILAQRKDKPKRESGIIFLGGGTCDSSTDYDPDDLISDPPSPCDFTFEGDNILINGKSNIQSKPKMRKMKIQFNDEATTMFEYPSEASLLDDQQAISNECGKEKNGPSASATPGVGLSNPFRCSNLASYTPSKVTLSNDFQLGVTKTSPSPMASRTEIIEQTEIEEYLRPADEKTTVTWSSETAADLLF